MPFGLAVERQIAAAIQAGEFDDLPNAGQPLNLEEYFATPEHLRIAYSILKNANCLPEELELMKEISRLSACGEANLSADDPRRLHDLRLTLGIRMEQQKKSAHWRGA